MSSYAANPPDAKVLMNSMRAMGYSLDSAVADIIDNSISANAHNITIRLPMSLDEHRMYIFDDGDGMNSDELLKAMRFGSNIEDRSSHDLGRFGLGLKTASLSQCRQLTVITKKNSQIAGMQWDLDDVISRQSWDVKVLSSEEISDFEESKRLNNISSGTLVVWDKFDKKDDANGNTYTYLYKRMAGLGKTLSLIFHRYISGYADNQVQIQLNAKILPPIDPFLEGHKKTTKKELISIPIKSSDGKEYCINAQPYVLPHLNDLSTEDKEKLGGMESIERQEQGFYVYRNGRLIIWGSWFGLPKDELSKYARVKVDIPNTLDDLWQIDIKKQHAVIPEIVKERLKNAVLKARVHSQRMNEFRGNRLSEEKRLWIPSESRGIFSYKINRNSTILKLLDRVDEKTKDIVEKILVEIEENLPYQDIYNKVSTGEIDIKHELDDNEKIEELKQIVLSLLPLSEKRFANRQEALKKIFEDEPFCYYQQLLSQMLIET